MAADNVLPVMFAVHPSQYQSFSTDELRQYFLINDLKKTDTLNLTYTHYDRLIAGTVIPQSGPVTLPTYENLKSNFFCERRELGVINVGGTGHIKVDGKDFIVEKYDCLYIPMGSKEIIFSGDGGQAAPLFYLLSARSK